MNLSSPMHGALLLRAPCTSAIRRSLRSDYGSIVFIFQVVLGARLAIPGEPDDPESPVNRAEPDVLLVETYPGVKLIRLVGWPRNPRRRRRSKVTDLLRVIWV